MNSQLAMYVNAVTKISVLWTNSNDEDRRGLAHTLFDEVVYDLDTQRIVSFHLKSWADQFIILRGTLYEGGNEGQNYTPKPTQNEQSALSLAADYLEYLEFTSFPQRITLEQLLIDEQ